MDEVTEEKIAHMTWEEADEATVTDGMRLMRQ
jgi:hypothetical protein